MRANDQIVQGDFLGGEIEPGTFHCGWYPSQFLHETADESDPQAASDAQISSASVRPRAIAVAVDALTDADTEQDVAQV